MPPTARSAPRGEGRGLPVLTAGPSACTGVTPPARWCRTHMSQRLGVLALFLPADPTEGREGFKTMTHRRHDFAVRRRGEFNRDRGIAAALADNRRPATSERPPSGSHPEQTRLDRSERSPKTHLTRPHDQVGPADAPSSNLCAPRPTGTHRPPPARTMPPDRSLHLVVGGKPGAHVRRERSMVNAVSMRCQ